MPHYWDHVRWVWGARDMEEFMRIAENVHLDGVLDRIKVPFLVTHGEKDFRSRFNGRTAPMSSSSTARSVS